MEDTKNVEELVRKTQYFEFSDGLRDLQYGLVFFFIGAVGWLIFEPFWMRFLIRIRDSAGVWAMWFGGILTLAIPVIIAIGMIRLMRTLRLRRLWRDTGIVKPMRILFPAWASITAGAIVTLGIVLVVVLQMTRGRDPLLAWQLLWAAAGWSLTFTFMYLGNRLKISRYIGLGIFGFIFSALLPLISSTFGMAALIFGIIWGIPLLVSGAFILRKTMSNTPAEENDD
ncbi:MAG: hypothetical protein MUO76_20870 [Anaerolineaceae bacterium]|nr:hypothetical protein [Anaerolineaceae bacterium]